MVSGVEAVFSALGPSDATVRVAPSGMSPPSKVVSVDRKNATLNGAGASTPLLFLTVLVTANGVPAATAAGAVTVMTIRSGSTTVIGTVASTLLASFPSVTELTSSDPPRMRYLTGTYTEQ